MARIVVVVMVGALFSTALPAGGASDPAPGIALKRTGTADCSKVMSEGSVLVLGVKVTGGHSICVTDLGEERSIFFDGRPGGGSSGDVVSQFGGIGTVKRRYVLFGFLPPSADSLRLTFCGGQTMVLRPLNESQPAFRRRDRRRREVWERVPRTSRRRGQTAGQGQCPPERLSPHVLNDEVAPRQNIGCAARGGSAEPLPYGHMTAVDGGPGGVAPLSPRAG